MQIHNNYIIILCQGEHVQPSSTLKFIYAKLLYDVEYAYVFVCLFVFFFVLIDFLTPSDNGLNFFMFEFSVNFQLMHKSKYVTDRF